MVFGLLVLGLLAIVACSILLRKFKHGLGRFLYLTSKIQGPTLWQMVTVHAKHLLGDNMATYACEMCDVYNYKPWGTWLMDLNYVIFVSDCETVSLASKLPEKPGLFYNQVSRGIGRTLLTMNGPEYPQYRKVYGNALRKSLLDLALPRMVESTSELVGALRERASSERDVDLRFLITSHTIKLSSASWMSDPPPEVNHVMQLAADFLGPVLDLFQIEALNPVYYWLFMRLQSSTRRTIAHRDAGFAALDDIIIHQKSRCFSTENRDDSEDIGEAFIRSFLKTVYCEDNDEQLCKEVRILLIASFDTTQFVVNCLILVLALYQDVQQRVCDEIASVLGEKDRPILAEDLKQMEYMEMVIKETLRLFPAGPMLSRRAHEDINLNGTQAPVGSTVVMNVMALHRNPEYFPDPLKFDPNRFSPEASKKLRPYSYIPFSAGVRQCPGQLHAFVMMKIMLCQVLRNFRILPGSKLKSLDDIKVKMGLTMHLKGSSLRLVDRSLETNVKCS